MPPPTPSDLSQDQGFLAAPRDRQVQYLSAQDPSFASAPPDRQQAYLDHLKPTQAAVPSTFAAPPGTPTVPKPNPNALQDTSTLSHTLGAPLAPPQTSMLGTIYGAAKNFSDKVLNTDVGRAANEDFSGLTHPTGPGMSSPYPGFDQDQKAAQAAQSQQEDQSRKTAGYSLPYRALAPVAEAVAGVNVPGMEQSAKEGSAGGVLGHTIMPLASLAAGEAAAHVVPKILGDAAGTTPKPTYSDTHYSNVGDHISSALRSNTKVDVPYEAKIAGPAIEEGLNDLGTKTSDFKGRDGPPALQKGIDNARDIYEARAKYAIGPIRHLPVDPQILAENPNLASRFAGKMPDSLTYGDLDAERLKVNKELRTSNFYSKAPSAQYAVGDPLANLHDAGNELRNVVYDKAQETTGVDLQPLKRTEAALIKLGDLAETTKNTLSPKVAQQATTPLLKKAQGSVQGILSAKANPINAFSIPEKAGLFNPSNEFNAHIRKAFPNLKAATADRTMVFPKYDLKMTPPPGQPPSPIQQLLKLSGGENVPGENLKLTHPPGKMPPDLQRPLPMEGGQNIPAKSIPDILGQGLIGGPGELTSPPGNMPPALQRVLPFQNPGVPSEAYPGVVKSALKAPKKK